MTKVRKLAVLLFSVIAVTAASVTAMAALPAGGFVPTYGEKYLQQDGKWVPVGTVSASYKKDGRCTSFSSTDSKGHKQGQKFTWSGNYITKEVRDYRDSGTYVYKYDKKHKLVYRTLGRSKYVYKWSGNTAVYSIPNYKETLTYNKKGQLTKAAYNTSKYTFTYYKNGNLKKSGGKIATTKFNKRGDLTSFSYSPLGMNATFKYQKDSNGRIEQADITYTDRNGTHNAKIVYSKWKKVSHVRNCDAAGTATLHSMMTDLLTLGSLFR